MPLTAFNARLNQVECHRTSWSLAQDGFEEILHRIRSHHPVADDQHQFINESSGKFVWRIQEQAGGQVYDFAYKMQKGKKPWRYILRSSLPVRECRNYQIFEALDIPVAPVLAVGDVRKNFILQESFLVTGFIDGTQDGRKFMPGGACRAERSLRQEYGKLNLQLLARIHDHNIFHKAFHPRNLLWKINDADQLSVYWIDVARCRKFPAWRMKRAAIFDLHTFFRDMLLTEGEVKTLIEVYLNSCTVPRLQALGVEGVFRELVNFRRRWSSRSSVPVVEK